jgi:hypothetical protein
MSATTRSIIVSARATKRLLAQADARIVEKSARLEIVLGLLLRRTPTRKSRIPGNAQSPRVSESLHTTGVVI